MIYTDTHLVVREAGRTRRVAYADIVDALNACRSLPVGPRETYRAVRATSNGCRVTIGSSIRFDGMRGGL